ncbi:UvrABC system protein B [Striga asiatica]|uniref:UvrABC system protein B n=1 Tax=Striga asiatica TaxID=4170 RepID=A0A5A7QWP0_STRAF|nr:UvrABC system protein B [Striga asiatica]
MTRSLQEHELRANETNDLNVDEDKRPTNVHKTLDPNQGSKRKDITEKKGGKEKEKDKEGTLRKITRTEFEAKKQLGKINLVFWLRYWQWQSGRDSEVELDLGNGNRLGSGLGGGA